MVYAKADFVKENPKLVTAFLAAQRQAIALIKSDRSGAIDKYFAVTGDKDRPGDHRGIARLAHL